MPWNVYENAHQAVAVEVWKTPAFRRKTRVRARGICADQTRRCATCSTAGRSQPLKKLLPKAGRHPRHPELKPVRRQSLREVVRWARLVNCAGVSASVKQNPPSFPVAWAHLSWVSISANRRTRGSLRQPRSGQTCAVPGYSRRASEASWTTLSTAIGHHRRPSWHGSPLYRRSAGCGPCRGIHRWLSRRRSMPTPH